MSLTPGAHWRDDLLADITLRPEEGEPVNRLAWPGYGGRTALRWGTGLLAGQPAVVAVWDGRVYGGSFGERDATAFAAAADAAAASRRPLVSFLRSGGTRLQEGVAALVGLPRATLALGRLARAGVAHLAVADAPTTGGVWVTVGSRADLRAAVAGATIGFAGPRVVAATTGRPVPPGSHTARSAYRSGLVDALLEPGDVGTWLGRTLAQLHPPLRGVHAPRTVPSRTAAHDRTGMEQVRAARSATRPSGLALLVRLVPDGTALRGPDRTVAARVGRLAASGRPVVGVALAADRGGRPTPDGYRLLTRAAGLAGRLDLPVVTLVDTPGADPSPAAEADGQAGAIGEAMAAVLGCPAPTVGVLVGEGGSGGALAAACTDVLLAGPDSYLAALAPEGAAATLRLDMTEVADRSGLRPRDLIALGLVDGEAPAPHSAAFDELLAAVVEDERSLERDERLAQRHRRWSARLDGHIPGYK